MIHIAYLRSLFKFAFKNNPLLYLGLLLSVISVCLELAAMTALMPLASLASAENPHQQHLKTAIASVTITQAHVCILQARCRDVGDSMVIAVK